MGYFFSSTFTSETLVKLMFFTTTLDLSLDGNVPTFLIHSPGCTEIEGCFVWCFFFKLYDFVEFHTTCVLTENQCAVKC